MPKTKTTKQTTTKKKSVAKKKPDTRTRTQKIRAEMQKSVREKMSATLYLNQLNEAAEHYLDIIDSTEGLQKKKLSARSAKVLFQIDSQLKVLDLRLKTLKGLVDLNLRRLKFVLPELKSVELKDPNGDNPFAQLGNTIAAITQEIGKDD